MTQQEAHEIVEAECLKRGWRYGEAPPAPIKNSGALVLSSVMLRQPLGCGAFRVRPARQAA